MKFLSKIVTVLLCFILLVDVAVAEFTFLDISESEYEESIISLGKKEVIHGYDNGEFRPSQTINRAELLKIVFKALNQNAADYPGDCFPDVKDEWYAPYVCKAKDLGVIKGYEDGTYRPGQDVNMAEALKIALEAFDLPLDSLKENEMWYGPYVTFAHRNNLFSKYAYLPNRPARREEVAFLVDELMQILKEEQPLSEVRNVKSDGCGKPTPATAPTKFMVNGVERSTITVVPSSYDPAVPMPIIFAFHGRTNSNQMVKGYYGIEKASDGKAIIVYPAGMPNAGGYSWADPGDSAGELRDYEFFDVMLEEFENSYCVNEDEVFVMGHSLGAWFSNSLACARGDKIRAVASLGGARSNSECTGPVAVMQWHNPNDQQAPYSTAVAARDNFLGQNQCGGDNIKVEPVWGNCVKYTTCPDTAPVLFCPHNVNTDWQGDYYPHTWPNDTGKEMWKFFQENL